MTPPAPRRLTLSSPAGGRPLDLASHRWRPEITYHLRSLFNSGHRQGGSINRFVGGRPQRYRTFAPLAVAAIGMLPLPLLHRSVLINMQRSGAQLRRLDEGSLEFHLVRQGIQKWAARCTLAPDPEMPPGLRNRAADN